MPSYPKFKYIRSKKLLQKVAELPCQLCGMEGRTQASHSNYSVHGKGRGIKSSDIFIAALCETCHFDIDQGSAWTRRERQQAWWVAHRKTVETLVANGDWPKDVSIPDGSEWQGLIPFN